MPRVAIFCIVFLCFLPMWRINVFITLTTFVDLYNKWHAVYYVISFTYESLSLILQWSSTFGNIQNIRVYSSKNNLPACQKVLQSMWLTNPESVVRLAKHRLEHMVLHILFLVLDASWICPFTRPFNVRNIHGLTTTKLYNNSVPITYWVKNDMHQFTGRYCKDLCIIQKSRHGIGIVFAFNMSKTLRLQVHTIYLFNWDNYPQDLQYLPATQHHWPTALFVPLWDGA